MHMRASRLLGLKGGHGFTLIEMIMAMGLSLALLTTVYGVFRAQSHSVKGEESRMEAHEYALSVLDTIVREIRNTGFFPTATPCGIPANVGGIVAATAQSFRLTYDSDGDGTCEEDVSFTYDAAGKNIFRNGASLTDGNATEFQLMYYPQQTSSTPPAPFCFSAANPVGCSGMLASNWNAVEAITITITIQAKSTDTEFGGQSTMTMSSTATLRNHTIPS
jgi:prepilin-type N-terminal cleavage/methylation domain-containing protein